MKTALLKIGAIAMGVFIAVGSAPKEAGTAEIIALMVIVLVIGIFVSFCKNDVKKTRRSR